MAKGGKGKPELSILKPPPAGGVDLREVMARKNPPATVHTTSFHQCASEFVCLLEEDGKTVLSYRLQITDPVERHIYNFDFPQQVRDGWLEVLKQFPDIGTQIEPDNPVMQ